MLNLHGLQCAAADGREGSGLGGAARRGTLFHFRVAQLRPEVGSALSISDRTELNLMVCSDFMVQGLGCRAQGECCVAQAFFLGADDQ